MWNKLLQSRDAGVQRWRVHHLWNRNGGVHHDLRNADDGCEQLRRLRARLPSGQHVRLGCLHLSHGIGGLWGELRQPCDRLDELRCVWARMQLADGVRFGHLRDQTPLPWLALPDRRLQHHQLRHHGGHG